MTIRAGSALRVLCWMLVLSISFLFRPWMVLIFIWKVYLHAHPDILSSSKWASYLPVKFRLRLLKQRYFDFEGAEQFKGVTWVVNRECQQYKAVFNSIVSSCQC